MTISQWQALQKARRRRLITWFQISTNSQCVCPFHLLLFVRILKAIISRPKHITLSPLEERQIEETVAAIRARTRYHDPYEEWEQETRRDAFVSLVIIFLALYIALIIFILENSS